MKKVLVIGAHSYIGLKFKEYITDYRIKDITVELVSASSGAWRKVKLSQYDTVLHLSGIVHRKEKKNMKSLYYEVNHKLAVEIAMKAKEDNVKQFIFMSTAAIYDSYTGGITKETIPNPATLYGKSKLAAEQDIMKLMDSNFNIAIIRPPMIYGLNCKGNFKKLLKMSMIIPVFPYIENKRSMIHIDNLCEFLKLLISAQESGYYHPQNKDYVCTSHMIKCISKSTEHSVKFTESVNVIILQLSKRFITFNKLFSDFYYDKSVIHDKIDLSQYQIIGFYDSIKKSL